MDRKEEFLKPGERLDDLQNGYWMIQNPSLFCYGIDAVLLASYAKVKRGERAMDFCTGSGIVPILLKAKTNGEHFSGLEIQEYSAEMAQRSVRYNHLENDVEIFQGDVKTASQQFGKEVFDVVTCNPPYMTGQHGLTNALEAKTIARHEVLESFHGRGIALFHQAGIQPGHGPAACHAAVQIHAPFQRKRPFWHLRAG